MSRKKGLSLEDKRTRMLEIFYETKEVFQLKELEKIAPKDKGIVAQSVKEVVQSLVDDGLVDSEKIGTSVYFWAFPSKATILRKNKIEELEKKLSSTVQKVQELETTIKKIKLSRNDTPEREAILKNLTFLQTEVARIEKLVESYKDCDPEVIAQDEKDGKKYKDGTNVWVDNIFAVKAFIKKKFFVEEDVINKQFDIPEELDYIE